jgi:hypothetical protein
MSSFCKAPPTAEQREQQHLEEGQKFKQQLQKQRADKGQNAVIQNARSVKGRMSGMTEKELANWCSPAPHDPRQQQQQQQHQQNAQKRKRH